MNETPVKRNYDFIDHIRCVAMMSIVFEHGFGSHDIPLHAGKFWAYTIVIQGAKFGTVIFFLLAGFLIGDKFTDYTPGQYLKRRFSSTFGPWLFWSALFVLCHIIDNAYHGRQPTVAGVLDIIRNAYLYTNYWFIINFMISITLLLIFKRYLYSKTLGAVLLSFTLLYCVDVHYEWFSPKHTTAIFGFIFFLWMGAQMRKHWAAIENRVKTIPYSWVMISVFITYFLSCCEMLVLIHKNSVDPYNTLRISNIFFSLAVFFLLLKIKHYSFLNYLKPRQTTYGLYLIHYIIIIFVINNTIHPFHINEDNITTLNFVLLRLGEFLLTYTITMLLVLGINKTRARVLIGN